LDDINISDILGVLWKQRDAEPKKADAYLLLKKLTIIHNYFLDNRQDALYIYLLGEDIFRAVYYGKKIRNGPSVDLRIKWS
jgi:hypothetical protein